MTGWLEKEKEDEALGSGRWDYFLGHPFGNPENLRMGCGGDSCDDAAGVDGEVGETFCSRVGQVHTDHDTGSDDGDDGDDGGDVRCKSDIDLSESRVK